MVCHQKFNQQLKIIILLEALIKFFFSQTDKIQLVGNATINYDDLSISSKEIIFNTRNGQVLSEN